MKSINYSDILRVHGDGFPEHYPFAWRVLETVAKMHMPGFGAYRGRDPVTLEAIAGELVNTVEASTPAIRDSVISQLPSLGTTLRALTNAGLLAEEGSYWDGRKFEDGVLKIRPPETKNAYTVPKDVLPLVVEMFSNILRLREDYSEKTAEAMHKLRAIAATNLGKQDWGETVAFRKECETHQTNMGKAALKKIASAR